MKLCVVGHGKSLEGAGLGHVIDSCDVVLRFKKGWQLTETNPVDYGTKMDFVMASTEVLGVFLMPEHLKAKVQHFIAYPKNGFYSEEAVDGAEKALRRNIVVPLNLSNYWNHQFRSMGGSHPNCSVGMAGIFILAHELRPKVILFAGMDALLNPDGGFHRIEAVPRTGAGPFPDHDWATENKLLHRLSAEYEFEFHDIRRERSGVLL